MSQAARQDFLFFWLQKKNRWGHFFIWKTHNEAFFVNFFFFFLILACEKNEWGHIFFIQVRKKDRWRAFETDEGGPEKL